MSRYASSATSKTLILSNLSSICLIFYAFRLLSAVWIPISLPTQKLFCCSLRSSRNITVRFINNRLQVSQQKDAILEVPKSELEPPCQNCYKKLVRLHTRVIWYVFKKASYETIFIFSQQILANLSNFVQFLKVSKILVYSFHCLIQSWILDITLAQLWWTL